MGVADNQSYKDQYHFQDDKFNVGKENPSIEENPKINSIIKENPYRSNVEIEGDEIVLQPDLTALFKAVGKKHKQGGMDVLLKPNSFIFSDFKDLAISDKDRELFELKDGGKYSDNTPADVLRKNVDAKHYNNLVNIMSDPQRDDLSKKTAARMLEKYISTLGNIAYIQESKKGFPTGVPQFAMGTAPVYDTELKNQIMANKQYMKAGGTVNNPYQVGGRYPAPGTYLPSDPRNNMPFTGPLVNPQVTPPPQNAATTSWGGFNLMGKIRQMQIDLENCQSPQCVEKKKQLERIAGPHKPTTPVGPVNPRQINPLHPGPDMSGIGVPNITAAPNGVPGTVPDRIKVPDLDITPQSAKTADWRFTPWQQLSQLYNWGQYANVKRYMPYRSRYNATYVDPALLNEQQATGTAKGVANSQISALGTLSPILRNAQAEDTTGQLINQIPQIGLAVQNQNAGITNQTRQYNNQTKNNESLVNMANDQTYYQQAIEGRKNFDNMRQYTANQAMNNVLGDVTTNQKLAYGLLTQNNPAYGFDWRTGNFTRNNKNIMDVQSNAVNDRYSALLDMINGISDPLEKAKLAVKLEGLKVFGSARTDNPLGKKGGKVKRNPYKW